MTPERQALLLIRGEIAELPEADRKSIELVADKLRELIAQHNDHGLAAFVLVGAELQAKD